MPDSRAETAALRAIRRFKDLKSQWKLGPLGQVYVDEEWLFQGKAFSTPS